MAGPITICIFYGESDKPDAVVANLSAYEAQQQLQALESQAVSMGRGVLCIVRLMELADEDEGEGDGSADESTGDQ